MPSSSAASWRKVITDPVPHSWAPVMICPQPSPSILMYAPDGTAKLGHQPIATPMASSSGSARP